MQIGEFRKAYTPLGEYPIQTEDETEYGLWNDARTWSRRFSYMLSERLGGEIMPETKALHTLREFMLWQTRFSERAGHYLAGKIEDESTSSEDWQTTIGFLNESHFHTMTAQMATNWARLLTGVDMSRHEVKMSQNSLAFTGIEALAVVHAAEQTDEFYARAEDGTHIKANSRLGYAIDPAVDHFRSIAGEADTAITLQELTLQDPAIIVVPAPGYFEHSRDGSLNVDFIAVDGLRSHVRGIQSKLATEQSTRDHYDSNFVTLIDGVNDLGNAKSIRLPRGSNRHVVPWPGLISAHHMLAQKDIFRERSQRGKGVALGPRERELVRLRHEARFLAGNTRSFNAKAARHVTERVLHDLYAEAEASTAS